MIGENIRKKRKALKMSQQELADAMGYRTRSTIAKIESGENDIPQSKLSRLARILHTSVEELLGEAHTLKEGHQSDNANWESKSIGIILAGGKSIRNLQNIPNQFMSVKGKPVIIYCLEAYQRHPAISEIYVACLSGWSDILTAYAKQYGITKFVETIPAGETGIMSIKNSVEWVNSKHSGTKDINIVFQESTRPMVTEDMISKVLQWCEENGSAIMSEPMDEYMQFIVDKENEITDQKSETRKATQYIDRHKLISIQSPEAHSLIKLNAMFEEAKKQDHDFSESCLAMLMFNLGKELVLYEGNHYNLKIIRQEDLTMFEALC